MGFEGCEIEVKNLTERLAIGKGSEPFDPPIRSIFAVTVRSLVRFCSRGQAPISFQ
jgi:hypothetical protein